MTITSKTKTLAAENCQTLRPFLCMKENVILVKENKSWEEAFEHCRGLGSNSNLRFNLLSVKPGDEHKYVVNRIKEADTNEVGSGGKTVRIILNYYYQLFDLFLKVFSCS